MTTIDEHAADETQPTHLHFGDVARKQIGEQCQYVARYVDGRHGAPNLGAGLRIVGDPRDYHALTIHRDDVEEFVRRVTDYRRANGIAK